MRDRVAIRDAREAGGAIRAIAREQQASRNAVRRALVPGASLRYCRPSSTEVVEEAVRDVLADYPHMTVEDIAVVIDWRRSRRTLSNLVAQLRPQYAWHDDVEARPISSIATGRLLDGRHDADREREHVTKPRTPPPPPERPEPPESMPADAAQVWREIVESNDLAGNVDRTALEAYCTLVARLRQAQQRVETEGMVVTDTRGRTIAHPALLVERQTAEQIRAWGDRFAPLVKPTRKRGYMADATAAAIAGAPHLADAKFAGAVAAVKTLAWLIDEAQRTSMDALQRAAFGTIPTYLKACAELQITPASVPAAPAAKGGGGGKLGDFQGAAARRRAAEQAAGA